jgi:hypothetical protein
MTKEGRMSETPGDVDAWKSRLRERAQSQQIGASTRAKEHAVAVTRWTAVHRWLVVTAAVTAAVASGAILASSGSGGRTVAGILSVIAAVAAGADVALGSQDTIDKHKQGLDGFTRLRTQWLWFGDRLDAPSNPAGEGDFEALLARRDELSEHVPVPPGWAKRAVARQQRERRPSRA